MAMMMQQMDGPYARPAKFSPEATVLENQRPALRQFAKKLDTEGVDVPPGCAMNTLRMDAAALCTHLARGNDELLSELQSCLLKRDMNGFVNALDINRAAPWRDIEAMRGAIKEGDKKRMAKLLRRMRKPGFAETMEVLQQNGQEWVPGVLGRELANDTDPLCGNLRRIRATVFNDGPLPNARGRHDAATKGGVYAKAQERIPDASSAMELGYDADGWEKAQTFHAYLYDGANAMMDLMKETMEAGCTLDGRTLDGNRAGNLG